MSWNAHAVMSGYSYSVILWNSLIGAIHICTAHSLNLVKRLVSVLMTKSLSVINSKTKWVFLFVPSAIR